MKIIGHIQSDFTTKFGIPRQSGIVKEIKGKLQTDYLRLNQIESRLDKTKETQGGLVEELEIIMRALLGVLRGLQEQGANGPTKEAEQEIQEYLTRKAHHINTEE